MIKLKIESLDINLEDIVIDGVPLSNILWNIHQCLTNAVGDISIYRQRNDLIEGDMDYIDSDIYEALSLIEKIK